MRVVWPVDDDTDVIDLEWKRWDVINPKMIGLARLGVEQFKSKGVPVAH